MGAAVAVEIVHQLQRESETAALILIDPRLQRPDGLRYASWLVARRARQRRFAGAVARRLLGRGGTRDADLTDHGPIWNALETARDAYVCRPTHAPAVLVQSEDFARFDMPDWYLRDVFPSIVHQEDIRGEHASLFSQPSVRDLHAVVERALDRLEPLTRLARFE